MDGTAYKDYFLQPRDVWHRRYEVLRAMFLDDHSMQEVAQRFGVTYGTVRNWVGEFRRQRDANERPPFSQRRSAGARGARPTTTSRRSPSLTCASCRWRRGAG
jgi:transposase